MDPYRDVSRFRRAMRMTTATPGFIQTYPYIQPRLDRLVYRLTRGRTTLSAWLGSMDTVMLTTTGAKSGEQRTQPLVGFLDDDGVLVIGSNYGRARQSGWYHNLRAHPRASVRTNGGAAMEVEARELEGSEREREWERAASFHPGFRVYARRAHPRRIPVMRLQRVS